MSTDAVNAADAQKFSHSQQPAIADDWLLHHIQGRRAHVQHLVGELGYRHPMKDQYAGILNLFQ